MATLRRPPRQPGAPPPPDPAAPPYAPTGLPAAGRVPPAAQPQRTVLASIGAFLKRWTIPVIGGVTPVGLILINIAVYINDHLQEERWFIAVAAFLSGMILNTWWALSVYRWVQQRWPHWSFVHERNQEMALVVGMSIVTAYSVLSAVYCYIGLGDTKHLPNAQTFLYGVFQIAFPFIGKVFFDGQGKRAERRNRELEGSFLAGGAAGSHRATTAGWTPLAPIDRPVPEYQHPAPPGSMGVPPQGPMQAPSQHRPGGYVPPGHLPPS